MVWQLMFACAVQLPLQLAWHCAVQEAEGGVPMHSTLHLSPHVAWHDAMHWDMLPLDEQLPEHVASQFSSHEPLQLKLPGLAVHCASHEERSQLPVQLAEADAEHVVSQLASSWAEHWSV
jgi:hypothetical protein